MPTDWSSVPLNADGVPIGHILLTPTIPPGIPLYVETEWIGTVQEDGPGTVVGLPTGRLKVQENIREVFRRKAEANTVGNIAISPPPPTIFPEPKPDRIRKKA